MGMPLKIDRETAREMFLAVHDARLELSEAAHGCQCQLHKSKPGKKHVDEPGIIAGQKAIAAVFAKWRQRVLTALENNPPVRRSNVGKAFDPNQERDERGRWTGTLGSGKHQTDSPEFKSWFGRSVVTADGSPGGKPLRVYHGTKSDFSEFSKNPVAQNYKGLSTFSFTTDPKHAEAFSGKKGVVMPVYLALKNPYFADILETDRILDDPKKQIQWLNKIKSKGHDGIVFEGSELTEYQVFSPIQIKSAIGNRGTFDPQDADITKSNPYHDEKGRFASGKGEVLHLYRAADSNTATAGTHFAEHKSDAEAYQDNPGFGGANLYEFDIPVVSPLRLKQTDARDLKPLAVSVAGITGEDARDLVDFWRNQSGYDSVFNVLENAKGVEDALAEKHDAIRFLDDFPENAATWKYLGKDKLTASDISKTGELPATNHPRLSAARKVWNWLRKAIGDEEELDPDDLDIEGMAEDGAFDPDMDEFDVEAILNEAFPNAGAEAIAELAAAMRVAQMEGCDTGIGLAGAQLGLDPEDIAAAVKGPLEDAMNNYALKFSESTWARIDGSIADMLVDGLVDGQAPKEMAETIVEEFSGLEDWEALRIARTEFARGQVEATLTSFNSESIRLVRFCATSDACPLCLGYDQRIWPIEMMFGVFPIHPHDRCYLDCVYELGEDEEVETEPPTNVFDDPDLAKDPWPTIAEEKAAKENAAAMSEAGGVGKALAAGEASSVAKYAPDQPRDSKGEFTTSMGEKVRPLRAVAFQHKGVTYAGKPGENHGILQDRLKREGVTGVDWPAVEEDYWKSQGFVDQQGSYINREDAEKKLRMDAESGEMRRAGALLAKSVDGWAFIRKYNEHQNRDERGRFSSVGTGAAVSDKVGRGQTQTAAFKAWFGGSKIVDSQGEPLVVYHGTKRDFAAFDSKYGTAMYFTDNKDYASGFSMLGRGKSGIANPAESWGSSVIPAYLSAKNPLDMTEFGVRRLTPEEFVSALKERGVDTKTIGTGIDIGADTKPVWLYLRRYDSVLDRIQDCGFDGIIQYEGARLPKVESATIDEFSVPSTEMEAKTFMVFSPTQVKSAIGNSGAFDPKQADIAKFNKHHDERGRFASGDGVANPRQMSTSAEVSTQQVKRDLTNTPEFKQWFKGSKIVDGKGNPLLVYHATWKDFDEFRQSEHGIFFSRQPRQGFGDKVVTAYLSLKNPLDPEYDGYGDVSVEWKRPEPSELIRDWSEQNEKDAQKLTFDDYIKHYEDSGGKNAYEDPSIMAAIKKAGYDGIIGRDKIGGKIGNRTEFIAFSPHQIMIASKKDADITKSDADVITDYLERYYV